MNIYLEKAKKPIGYIVLWQFFCAFLGIMVAAITKYGLANECYNKNLTTFWDGYVIGLTVIPIFVALMIGLTFITHIFKL